MIGVATFEGGAGKPPVECGPRDLSTFESPDNRVAATKHQRFVERRCVVFQSEADEFVERIVPPDIFPQAEPRGGGESTPP